MQKKTFSPPFCNKINQQTKCGGMCHDIRQAMRQTYSLYLSQYENSNLFQGKGAQSCHLWNTVLEVPLRELSKEKR